MSSIAFNKMHGLGNDFVVINGADHPLPSRIQIVSWADRHRGIGFDQLLYVSVSQRKGMDFEYRIFNADGKEVEQCGNGARCVAAFIRHHRLSLAQTLKLHCLAGDVLAHFVNDEVCVNLGPLKKSIETVVLTHPVDPNPHPFICVNLGNPHAVLFVSDVAAFDLDSVGQWANESIYFPAGVNLEIVSIIDTHRLNVRVFERGVGETQACGSGACAAAIAAAYLKKQTMPITVQLPGGALFIEWEGNSDSPILMTGPARFVFSGEIVQSH